MSTLKSKLKKLILRLSKVRYFNRWIIFLVDLCLSILATILVILTMESNLRYSVTMEYGIYIGSALASALSIYAFKSYTNVIRHSTLREIWRLLFMVVLKDIILTTWIFLGGFMKYFKVIFLGTDFLLTFFMLLCFRIFLQNVYNVIQMSTFTKKKKIYDMQDNLLYTVEKTKFYLKEYTTEIYQNSDLSGEKTANINKFNSAS